MFNLFNHTNYSTPDNGVQDSQFGQITSAAGFGSAGAVCSEASILGTNLRRSIGFDAPPSFPELTPRARR
jgi:hypothetical protein